MANFHSTRMSIRALLVSALLVLGHVLLTVSASGPVTSLTPDQSLYLTKSIKSLSAIIFLTLLWIVFSLLELADTTPEGDNEGGHVFARTWVELSMNTGLFIGWSGVIREAIFVLQVFNTSIAKELVLLQIAYPVALLTITALEFQMIYSVLRYTNVHGLKALAGGEFWNARSGSWSGRVVLEGEGEEVEVNEKEAVFV